MKLTKNRLMAFCLGIIYVWFGILKFFPNVSPAEDLAKETITLLTFGLIPSSITYITLAVCETTLGVLLLLNKTNRPVITMGLIHIIFTFSPILFFPDEIFNDSPFKLSMIGQYIMKNILILGVLIVLLQKNNTLEINFRKQKTT